GTISGRFLNGLLFLVLPSPLAPAAIRLSHDFAIIFSRSFVVFMAGTKSDSPLCRWRDIMIQIHRDNKIFCPVKCFVIALVIIGAVLAVASTQATIDDGSAKTGRDAKISRLIRQLGDESFAEREAATRALEAIGEPAYEAIRVAAENDPDVEIRH